MPAQLARARRGQREAPADVVSEESAAERELVPRLRAQQRAQPSSCCREHLRPGTGARVRVLWMHGWEAGTITAVHHALEGVLYTVTYDDGEVRDEDLSVRVAKVDGGTLDDALRPLELVPGVTTRSLKPESFPGPSDEGASSGAQDSASGTAPLLAGPEIRRSICLFRGKATGFRQRG